MKLKWEKVHFWSGEGYELTHGNLHCFIYKEIKVDRERQLYTWRILDNQSDDELAQGQTCTLKGSIKSVKEYLTPTSVKFIENLKGD